ncbi:hypothetical protein [Actinomycetospora aeridis]|uniref:Uncharacterized protein n=1 Tax=Actinomycetospora aeridis TaxID=3129231 RepID=A0ABU8N2T7_9PSEU
MTRRTRTASGGFAPYVLAAVGIFLFALLVVTGAELVIGHPLSGGSAGETTMGALFVTPDD